MAVKPVLVHGQVWHNFGIVSIHVRQDLEVECQAWAQRDVFLLLPATRWVGAMHCMQMHLGMVEDDQLCLSLCNCKLE